MTSIGGLDNSIKLERARATKKSFSCPYLGLQIINEQSTGRMNSFITAS
jgi:hypothetical protein